MEPGPDNQPGAHQQDIPAQVFRDSFKMLQVEMRANALAKEIRDLSGERSKRFKDWLGDVERVGQALEATNERYKTLAFQSLRGSAGEFLSRFIQDHPNHGWRHIRQALVAQYSDEGDAHLTSQKLRRLQQKSGETIQNFGGRILSLASEAYDNTGQPLVQSILMDVLIGGVRDDSVAKRLIKAQPHNFQGTLDIAINEQATARQFKLRRRADKPMKVDMVSDGNKREGERLEKLEAGLSEVVAQMGNLMTYMQGRTQEDRSINKTNMPGASYRPYGSSKSNEVQGQGHKDQHYKDGKPICFICHKVGHIAKHCRSNGNAGGYQQNSGN